jgi:suppressor of G2 allele of SKP1
VSFPHPSNRSSSFIFALEPLFALIDPSASGSSIMSTKVEVSLRKKVPGQKWPALEGSAPLKDVELGPESAAAKGAVMSSLAQPAVSLSSQTAPSYPTSSKSGPKNWDKLAETLTAKKKSTKKSKTDKDKENEKSASSDEDDGIDSDYETGDAVDGFFKKLYASADDDTKRAMMKSFQESNGTALSTNWSEVGKGKVEPVKSKDDD